MDSAYSKSPNPVFPRIELISRSMSGIELFANIESGSRIPRNKALARIMDKPHRRSISSVLLGIVLSLMSDKDAWKDSGRNSASVSNSRPFNYAPRTFSVEYLSGNESTLRCNLWTKQVRNCFPPF